MQSYNFSTIFTSFWFLYTLFVCTTLFIVLSKITNLYFSTFALSLAILLIPGFEFIKFSIPFFGIGLILRKENIIHKVSQRWSSILLLSIASCVFYLLLWNKNWYIYITANPSLILPETSKWMAYIGRILFGSIITISILSTLMKILELPACNSPHFMRIRQKAEHMSNDSLGLYVVHLFILLIFTEYIEVPDIDFFHNQHLVTLLCFIISIGLVLIILPILNLFKQNRLLKYHC